MFRPRDFSKTVAAGTQAIIATIPVPSQSKFTLLQVGNFCNNQGAWGSLVWIVRRNGVEVFPYDYMKDPSVSGVLSAQAEGVVFNGGDVLDVLGINDYSVDVEMGISLGYDQE